MFVLSFGRKTELFNGRVIVAEEINKSQELTIEYQNIRNTGIERIDSLA